MRPLRLGCRVAGYPSARRPHRRLRIQAAPRHLRRVAGPQRRSASAALSSKLAATSVTNLSGHNWSASKDLTDDDRYTVKDVSLLSARAGRAFHEMTPIRYTPAEPGRVYRKIAYGPMLDVFFLDMRSYRAANSDSLQETASEETRFLGDEQIRWLKRELANSRATWKVIAADMPIGLVVPDGDRIEAIANGDNAGPKGREFEIADLLRYIKNAGIENTVWFTADVHYTAAHYYNPDKPPSRTSSLSGNSFPARFPPARSAPTSLTARSARNSNM